MSNRKRRRASGALQDWPRGWGYIRELQSRKTCTNPHYDSAILPNPLQSSPPFSLVHGLRQLFVEFLSQNWAGHALYMKIFTLDRPDPIPIIEVGVGTADSFTVPRVLGSSLGSRFKRLASNGWLTRERPLGDRTPVNVRGQARHKDGASWSQKQEGAKQCVKMLRMICFKIEIL